MHADHRGDAGMCAQVPPQVLCPYERAARRFVCRNARVEDPVELLKQERQLRPWTPEEKRIFNEKFLVHPKVCRRLLDRVTISCGGGVALPP